MAEIVADTGAWADMVGKLTQKLPLEQMQPQWAAQLNPVLKCPLLNGRLVTTNVDVGVTTVNHGLGRKLIGWIPVSVSFTVILSDRQDTNPTPELTLSLFSTAPAVVTLWVF